MIDEIGTLSLKGQIIFDFLAWGQNQSSMATTQTLQAKYPDWTQEDWDRFRWINSWNRRRRNLAPLLPCKRCGTTAIFEEDHEDMPYHNMFTLGCPKCHRYLETTTNLSPVQFWGGFGNQKCTLSVVQNRVPLHMVRQWNYYNSPGAQRQKPGRRFRKNL
jgi:hypothetical protein